jgi:serine/threonine protein kinase
MATLMALDVPTGLDALMSVDSILKSPPTDSSVRKLGHYIVKETLGEGGFSKVKLGIHEKTGEKVALKLLKNKSKLTKPIRKQVEREIAAMSQIDHPNVLRMKEVDWECVYTKKNGKKQNVILIVLELATGGELFEFLSYTGFFEESIARTYFQQLMAGVEFCHAKGVVHRDLKPENLLLDEQFTLKLADFGFSNVVCAAHKLMFTECGTPGYMAPEMLKSKGYDGTKADIWACGVILFIMLAGFPPFQKPSPSDWWFNKLSNNKHALFWQAHSRSAYFSDQTKDFINKILNPDAEKRISITDMKKHPWWKGATITNASLIAELNRRKTTLDQVKNKEKEKKKKEKESLTSDVVMRGHNDPTADDLPPSPPKFTFKHQVYEIPTHEVTKELDFEDTKEGKPLVLDSSVARYTRFPSTASAAKIVDRVSEVIHAMSGKTAIKDNFKLKAQFGPITFVAQVFTDPSSEKNVVVDFRKKTGSGVEFRNLYQEIRAQLADIVLQPTVPSSSKSTETTDLETSS